jgi:hypothetical protein
MSNLINELKSDHAKLIEILENVKAVGPTSKKGIDLLRSAKSSLYWLI